MSFELLVFKVREMECDGIIKWHKVFERGV